MGRVSRSHWIEAVTCLVAVIVMSSALGNGGPFVIKYPDGDPAAKGVLARLDPDLKPARESRLRVVREDLKVEFGKKGEPHLRRQPGQLGPPLAHVTAAYVIENPTDETITVDFGFPILRGIYISPFSMMPMPDARVRLGERHLKCTVISNSAIYGMIRERARSTIDAAVNADEHLNDLVTGVRGARPASRELARDELRAYLVDQLGWTERDAVLMVEYAGLDLGKPKGFPADRGLGAWATRDEYLRQILNANLGPLAAIGEQKATQFFAQLASRFDRQASATYESIFAAWGGDVREKAVDLVTGELRPREITVSAELLNTRPQPHMAGYDPTIYARVDYLDPSAPISDLEKESCQAILKNLPVVFTFAPMNILHYQVEFPARSTETLTVTYSQYAYRDTRSPKSYQLAYVVHPASLWDEFGPIRLQVVAPEGVNVHASVPLLSRHQAQKGKVAKQSGERVYLATLREKTGELYLAVDAAKWDRHALRAAVARQPGELGYHHAIAGVGQRVGK